MTRNTSLANALTVKLKSIVTAKHFADAHTRLFAAKFAAIVAAMGVVDMTHDNVTDIVEPSNAEQSEWLDATRDYVRALETQNATLRKQLENAREALGFYANLPCNLEFGVVNECPYDDGATAREALKGQP